MHGLFRVQISKFTIGTMINRCCVHILHLSRTLVSHYTTGPVRFLYNFYALIMAYAASYFKNFKQTIAQHFILVAKMIAIPFKDRKSWPTY